MKNFKAFLSFFENKSNDSDLESIIREDFYPVTDNFELKDFIISLKPAALDILISLVDHSESLENFQRYIDFCQAVRKCLLHLEMSNTLIDITLMPAPYSISIKANIVGNDEIFSLEEEEVFVNPKNFKRFLNSLGLEGIVGEDENPHYVFIGFVDIEVVNIPFEDGHTFSSKNGRNGQYPKLELLPPYQKLRTALMSQYDIFGGEFDVDFMSRDNGQNITWLGFRLKEGLHLNLFD